LLETSNQDQQMPRMRGQFDSATEGPRKRKVFDRAIVMPLQIHMKNIQLAKMEETDWIKHWINFTKWEMEEGSWKEETEFLEKAGIQHILGAPQVLDTGRWK
jgi:hypothetical protein